jgi:hypothetical protein
MYQLTLRKGQTTMNVSELPELTTLNMDDREKAIIALVNQKYLFTPYEYTNNSNVPVAGSPVTFERVINDLQAEFVRKTQFMDIKFNYLAGLEAQSGVAEEFHECIDIEDSSEDDIDVGDVLDTLTFVPFTEECRDTYAKEIDFIIKNSSTVGVAARLAEFGSNKIVDAKWKIIFDLVKAPATKWKAWKGFDFEICKAFQSYTGMSLTTCGLIGIAIGTVLAGIKSIINYIGKNVGMAFQNLVYEGKFLSLLGLAALMAMVVGVALSDETIPFPFWQHASGVTSFWSITNYGCANPVTVTINLLDGDGNLVQATTGTIDDGKAWLPDTATWGGGWYTSGDSLGFGLYQLDADADCVYLWEACYGLLPQGQTGFTVIMPLNPYGVP